MQSAPKSLTALVFASPPQLRLQTFPITHPGINCKHEPAQVGSCQPAPKAMPPFCEVLIVGTHADANRAVAVLGYPVAETLLAIYAPLSYALYVGLVVNLV